MNQKAIIKILVEKGQELSRKPKEPVQFTNNTEANNLLNDLTDHPHAFVLACVMDRQITAEKAWSIPFKISEKIHDFSMKTLLELSEGEVYKLMSEPQPLHRFVSKMSACFFSAVQRIERAYSGDASNIWSNKPSSSEVVYRFLQFEGVGPKIATMAANILARDFKIPFSDKYSIDISPDIHIRRVFFRLGLCDEDATVEQVIYKARALHPQYPGVMDFPCWEIGRTWCKPRNPLCNECYMKLHCPTGALQNPAPSEND